MPRFRHRALSSNFLSFGRYNLLSILSFDLLSLNQLDLHRTSIGVRNKTNTRIVKISIQTKSESFSRSPQTEKETPLMKEQEAISVSSLPEVG
jgi:hypothetical protein